MVLGGLAFGNATSASYEMYEDDKTAKKRSKFSPHQRKERRTLNSSNGYGSPETSESDPRELIKLKMSPKPYMRKNPGIQEPEEQEAPENFFFDAQGHKHKIELTDSQG